MNSTDRCAMTYDQKQACVAASYDLANFLRENGHPDNAERVVLLAHEHVQRVPTKSYRP